ncbi:SDR family NAD(P)-dependent oxidoreductase [Seongchinamella unica]|uniref:SDR family NAD(P)-dependent oxidoreductase n=1 Tax=Seongchinamella unica TaxID=2547392 RepID=A0A4R5LVI8_9GAMM|nr:SDR family NAD(P)-dependent oxidoreductase [Seongchinamella unica]TDG15466.1 SDR family NAD(P)-dependent oxidoreductase [Seongchinamella unica]
MDLNGKHIVITGATAGIGRSSALTLGQLGADLTLLNRNPEKAEALAEEVMAAGGSEPTLITMDMARLDSVREAAAATLALGKPIDVLLNNAGLVNTERRVTADGFEETLAVNHFAPFLLTGLLLPALQQAPAARIVNVASDAHAFVKGMGFEDMQAEQSYKTFREYGRSKLANILFTRSLATRLADSNITVNCLHPGAVATSLGSQNEGLLANLLPKLLKPFFRNPDKGAETSIYLCQSDAVAGISGAYFANCKQAKPKPWARDDAAAARLWEISEDCTGFHYP